ncbi:MAG: carbohydrate-binding domain-containing protein [Ruminococcus sp.]|uniref:carbohydrate-binding domain-containing protein n=1 Tax=Ruminococcus sp. TaxID=41978 RepID=UPI0025CEFD09|nr:carbohydrate-binding domain-containing protein [Ruminococcus sp.]MBO4865403.1 carbohydrate-binding domain-containing protein [Ruminococcus sp.]
MKARLMMKRVSAAVAAAAMVCSTVSLETFAYSGSYDNSFTFTNSGISASNAAGSGYKINGTSLTINEAGTYVVSGQCVEGSITVKKGTTGVVLILDELTLTCSSTAPVSVNKGAEAEIVINGKNTLTDSENPANENSSDTTVADAFEGAGIKVKSGSSLTLTGTGTLTVNGSSCKNGIKGAATSTVTVGESANDSFTLNVNAVNNALAADGELIINGGNINVTSSDDGIKASPDDDDTESKGTVTINGGKISVTASDDAVHAEQVNVLGGNLTINAGNDGLKAENALTVGKADGSGPEIDVKKSYEGFEGATITLRGGKGSILSSDDGMNAANSELKNFTYELNISGGEWYVNADGDGVDSNGNMSISGGYTEVFGAANNGNGALDIGDFGNSLTYTGGTIVAVGMNGMAVTPTSGNYIAFGTSGMGGGFGGGFGRPGSQSGQSGSSYSISKGASIAIKDSSGNTLYEATAVKSANHVVFASESLKSDVTYTLYVNGQSVATATLTAGTGQPGGQGQPGQGQWQPGQGQWNPWQGQQPWQPGQGQEQPGQDNPPDQPTQPEEPETDPTANYPKVTKIEYSEKYHQFRLTWDAVDGAEKYGVAVYLAGKWKVVDQNITTTTFTSPKLAAGQTYKMVVCAKINGSWDISKINSRAFTVTVK